MRPHIVACNAAICERRPPTERSKPPVLHIRACSAPQDPGSLFDQAPKDGTVSRLRHFSPEAGLRPVLPARSLVQAEGERSWSW